MNTLPWMLLFFCFDFSTFLCLWFVCCFQNCNWDIFTHKTDNKFRDGTNEKNNRQKENDEDDDKKKEHIQHSQIKIVYNLINFYINEDGYFLFACAVCYVCGTSSCVWNVVTQWKHVIYAIVWLVGMTWTHIISFLDRSPAKRRIYLHSTTVINMADDRYCAF